MNAPLPPHLLSRFAEMTDDRMWSAEPEPKRRPPSLLWPEQEEIALCAVGFEAEERALLDSMVQLSQRRKPRLNLLPPGKAHLADVIMIDTSDRQAVTWSDSQDWLDRRAVIWVNGRSDRPGHTLLRRPIQWPMLPVVLARAMRTVQPQTRAIVPRTKQPDAPMVMVVAEEADTRRRLRAKLEAAGCRVTGVRSAREGLAALHAAPYACVFLAGEVPDADGLEVCRRLRRLERRVGRVPMVMLGDKLGTIERWRAKWAGCDDIIPEPERGKELRRLMSRLGDRSSSASPRARPSTLN